MANVFALIAADELSSPCRLLFQAISHARQHCMGIEWRIGMFLLSSYKSTPAIDEANRRSFQVEILWQRYPFDAWVIRQGLKVIREYQINILESHGTKPAFVAWCLKRVTGISWIAYAHGYTSESRRMAIYNQLDRWLIRDRKSTRLNSSHIQKSRMPSSA